MRYQIAQYSLRGARPSNQDRVAVGERDNAVLMVLADGLGGHRGGEIAAETLTASMMRSFQTVRQKVIARPSAFLAFAILRAHDEIQLRARTHRPAIEPRSTCVACLVQHGYAYWAHVGDSRLYHFRNGEVLRRTQDHTAVEQLREEGFLTDAEAGDHPIKGRLLKCVGGPSKPSIDLGPETALEREDTLLLCSDGLWGALEPAEIARFLARASLEEGVEEMLHAAEDRTRGHSDNITATCLRWEDLRTSAPSLQGRMPMHVDEDTLREDAWIWRTETKIQQQRRELPKVPTERSGDTTPEDVKESIQEIEEFLRRFEPK
jgi:serine/threonine protein phosphatase PrpC